MGKCACGKDADCPLVEGMCQDCWEKECDADWWDELRAAQEEEDFHERQLGFTQEKIRHEEWMRNRKRS